LTHGHRFVRRFGAREIELCAEVVQLAPQVRDRRAAGIVEFDA